MPRLSRVLAAAGRGAAWLLPARQRDWVAAVWTEAHAVPPGLSRLAWRAGGIAMVARETLMPRRLGKVALFAATAAAAAWAAWPQPGAWNAAVGQFHVIGTVLLLAGLPLLARRLLGPASPNWTGRVLRVFCYAAFLSYLPAMAITRAFAGLTPAQPAYRRIFCAIEACGGTPRKTAGSLPWAPEILLLLLIAGYVSIILVLTSRRSRVTGGTLAIGGGTGLLLGVVMYAVAPLGLNHYATNPWLPGSRVDPLVALAWILLLGGPAAAAVLVSRRCRGPGERPSSNARAVQGIAAGVLASLTGALFVTALGTGTVALLLESSGLRHWFSPGQPLTGIAAYRTEIYAGTDAMGYLLIFFAFPVIGLLVSAAAAGCANPPPREAGSAQGR